MVIRLEPLYSLFVNVHTPGGGGGGGDGGCGDASSRASLRR